MFTDHLFFFFFDGPGREDLADEFKAFLDELLGGEAAIGWALIRPWKDSPKRLEDFPDPLPGVPASAAECRGFAVEPAAWELVSADLELEAEDLGLEDPPWDLEPGAGLPQEWLDCPITVSIPCRSLPALDSEERRSSFPAAQRIVRWLRRGRRRRRKIAVEVGAGYFSPVFFSSKKLTPASLLALACLLQEDLRRRPPELVMELDFACGAPQAEDCSESEDFARWAMRMGWDPTL